MAAMDGANPELITAAEGNYLEAWRVLVRAADTGHVEETDDILFCAVSAPVAFFNAAFVKPPADPVGCIEPARAFFGACQTPFTLRFRGSTSSRADEACTAAGLVADHDSPLMVAATSDIAPPPDLDIRLVDASTWDEHLATIAAGFGMPLDLLEGLLAPALLDGDYAGFNAYVDGNVASTASLLVTGDVAGVYNVATPGAFRRRGLGEATTSAAVAEGARRGCTLTTLQASAMGYPVYERMGYRTVAHWRNFVSQ